MLSLIVTGKIKMADIGTVLKKEGKFPRKLFLQKKDYMRAWKQ